VSVATPEGKEAIERWAAAYAAEATSAIGFERRDRNTGEQIRDFDLRFADGHEEPLEVTIHADAAIVQTKDRVARREWRLTAAVRRLWLVPLPPLDETGASYDIRRCERELLPIIERLDAANVTDLDADISRWTGPFREDAIHLLRLGIHRVSSVAPPPGVEPHVMLGVFGGGAVPRDAITAAVEEEAREEGNQRKLAASGHAPRRHLFVVLTLSSTDHAGWALLNLMDGKMALPPLPTLPAAITTVWAATREGGAFVTPPNEWMIFRPSPEFRAKG
jgi:hypothetical protein